MTEYQAIAQGDTYASKTTQQQRVLEVMAEQGFITMLGAWEDRRVRITKLSTRIGEIESKCGHRFQREPMYRTDSTGRRVRYNTRYTIPAGLTIEDFKA